MGRSSRNNGKTWARASKLTLMTLAKQNIPTRLIAWKMGRTTSAI